MTKVKLKKMMTISQLNYLTKNKVIANNRTLCLVVGEDDADGADDEEVDDDGSDGLSKALENS